MTLLELITMSMKDIGAYNLGDTLDAQEAQDAINALNTMVDMWNIGLAIYASTRESFALTIGTQTYTWGTGGTFSTARPVKLTGAFVRDSGGNDYPVELISEPQWDSIPEKTDTGRPFCLFYNPAYPLAEVNLYYVPDLAYTLYTDSDKDLGEFTSLTATIALPPEYIPALRWNLAAELCPMYKKPVPPKVEQMAMISLAAVKRLHASEKNKPVKLNQFPQPGPGGFWKAGDIRSGLPY